MLKHIKFIKPMKISVFLSSLILFCISTINIFALNNNNIIDSEQDIILAPTCFIKNNSFNYSELVYNEANQLILFAVDKNHWLEHLNTINHTQDCGRFINVYDKWQQYIDSHKLNSMRVSNLDYEYFLTDYLTQSKSISRKEFTSSDANKINNNKELLESLYSSIDQDRISSSLDEFTSHYNRAAHTSTGYQAAEHVKNWMKQLAIDTKKSSDEFSVSFVSSNHPFYKQPSVVAVLGRDLPGKALVISGHMDTNGGGRRPGADDDGSGSMVVLEAARVILESGHKFTRPIYFMWYAAEEIGLVGSEVVASEARAENLQIDSVMHFDTVGRRVTADDPTLWLLKDNVDIYFTKYVAQLIKDHVKVPVNYTSCGYKCSDHASWNDQGYAATALFESAFENMNPYLHTSNDTREHVYIKNLVNLTKLSLAYAVDKAS